MASRISLLLWEAALAVLTAHTEETCAISGEQEDAASFLQMGPPLLMPERAAEYSLRFMHIPKTGGTSIDSANMHLPPGHRAYDSYMLRTYQRVAASSYEKEEDLGILYDESHSNHLSYGLFMLLHHDSYRFLPPGALDVCEDIHTPPSRSADVALYYQEITTFCSVREPLSRYFSAFKMLYGECDPKSVEKQTLELLAQLSTRPYSVNCFFVPQVEHIWGVSNKTAATHQYCKRILHQENLDIEFANLMAEYGLDARLPAEDLMSSWTDHCNMSADDLTPLTKAGVYEYFKADYEAFGYPKPDF